MIKDDPQLDRVLALILPTVEGLVNVYDNDHTDAIVGVSGTVEIRNDDDYITNDTKCSLMRDAGFIITHHPEFSLTYIYIY